MALSDKVALVTGGTKGIGAAIVEKLAADGTRVVAVARHRDWEERLGTLVGEGRVSFLPMDVTDIEGVDKTFDQVIDEFGRLDILVNNAGISLPEPLETLSLQKWDRVMDVNLRSVIVCSQKALPHLKETHGVIVNMASMSGIEPYAFMGAYSASKAAVVMLTRQMAYEWAPHGIRVNAVCPGNVYTPMTQDLYDDPEALASRLSVIPLKRIGSPAEVAALAAFLVSEAASYITGQAVLVDGGLLGTIQMQLRGRATSS